MNLESTCQFPQHNSEKFYCYCIDSIDIWGRIDILTILNLSMDMVYLSIYLDLLQCLLTMFCSFQCRGPAHPSLDFLIFVTINGTVLYFIF